MITRVPLAHQERMLRHLAAQAADLRTHSDRLKESVRGIVIPPVMSGTICSHCGIRYARRDGSCICRETSR